MIFVSPAHLYGWVSDAGIQSKRLSTIIVDNYYPYTFVNKQGEPDGFSVDLIKAVTQAIDLALDIRVDDWNKAVESLKAGKVDLLPMMAYSKDRDVYFDFSVPHTIAFDAFFTREGEQKIESMEDLYGKTIFVMKQDQAHNYLQSIDSISPDRLILTNSIPETLEKLSSGKGDVALIPKLVGLIFLKKMDLKKIEISPMVMEAYKRPFSFAVKHGNQVLSEQLTQGLLIVKETGQYRTIYEKWFGAYDPVEISMGQILKSLIGWVAGIIALCGILLLWSLSLKKQVTLRTKHLEEEIKVRKKGEKKLKELMKDLTRRNEELDDFTYIASHDLQEPLRKLTAFSSLLKKDLGEDLPENVEKDLDFISDAASRMQKLIQDLLAFSRSGRKDMNIEKINLDKCIDDALYALSTRLEKTHAHIDRKEFPLVIGDRALITQLYQNLIGNAVKFTQGTQPKIRLTAEITGYGVELGVRDNGIGIRPEYQTQIFQPFKRLHGRSEYDGSGIGLAICQKIAERHGSKISVKSEPGKGSLFVFTLKKA
ncbi:transporter substrate-binding domain-containing protein [Desulfobacula toluolica]|uniref:histidine kinase n=1 Tax=Desulfobacula toluolica (strain DSM 7467 / Tol2) TaxID=651182 RepID=K0NE78_DESTT|nr:transporter substrate-binding domain-containing protein [Desulfobacula toluolica]CCK79301.1 two component system sensor histidine kinase [Desulfobacula toluolica Tol2]